MAIKKPAAAAAEGINFGRLEMYAAGGGLPEGDYVIADASVVMHSGFGEQKFTPRLGVIITFKSLTDPTEEGRPQFYSMGTKADQSFAPNPETGKGLVAVPGGPGTTLNNSTNWAVFLKSLYDSGLPAGIFENDLTVLEGTWVHMQNVPEPESRKGFAAATGEAAQEKRLGSGTIAVVSEIKEGGAPWDGGGGIPDVAPAKPNGKAVAAAARPAAAAVGKGRPAPKAAAAAEPTAEEIMEAAVNGVTSVLEKSPNGVTKLLMRTGTFKAVKEAVDEGTAQAVIDNFFADDDSLNTVLSQLGYVVHGAQIVAQS